MEFGHINPKAAPKEFREITSSGKIRRRLRNKGISWKFITPNSPKDEHARNSYERLNEFFIRWYKVVIDIGGITYSVGRDSNCNRYNSNDVCF